MKKPAYIAIDWGSSRFRAYLLTQHMDIIESIDQPEGVKQHQYQDYTHICKQLLNNWSHVIQKLQLPLFMAGMVGSNMGWHEVPYLPCPLSLSAISKQIVKRESPWNTNMYIIPGVKLEQNRHMDIMRGEETLVIGALELMQTEIYCLPGTHSKWIEIKNKELQRFTTIITGELYAILKDHSLLAQGLPTQRFNQQWFDEGIMEMKEFDASLLINLFNVRAKRILNKLPKTSVLSYLSGLLIGAELSTMQQKLLINKSKFIGILAPPMLKQNYASACHLLGICAKVIDNEIAFIKGIHTIIEGINDETE